MKRLTKLQTMPDGVDFTFAPELFGEATKVQGGLKRTYGNVLYVESGGRYKLYSQTKDYLCFLKGSGHFKWARGETPFSCGDCFLAEDLGEYEVNGICAFTVVRQ